MGDTLTVYFIYCDRIKNEIQELHQRRNFSLTWATQEYRYLLSPLVDGLRNDNVDILNSNLLIECIKDLPLLLVESDGKRLATSLADFYSTRYFWTIECRLFRSAEELLHEIPSRASLNALINTLGAVDFQFPQEPVLCSNNMLGGGDYLFDNKEIDIIKVYKNQRRIDCRWIQKTASPRWLNLSSFYERNEDSPRRRSRNSLSRLPRPRSRHFETEPFSYDISNNLMIPLHDIEVQGLSEEIGVKVRGETFLNPSSDLTSNILSIIESTFNDNGSYKKDGFKSDLVLLLMDLFDDRLIGDDIEKLDDFLNRYGNVIKDLDMKKFLYSFRSARFRVFNLAAWERDDDDI